LFRGIDETLSSQYLIKPAIAKVKCTVEFLNRIDMKHFSQLLALLETIHLQFLDKLAKPRHVYCKSPPSCPLWCRGHI